MDTRIEELASIIIERCEPFKGSIKSVDDRIGTYWQICRLAKDIKLACEAYHTRHPEDY